MDKYRDLLLVHAFLLFKIVFFHIGIDQGFGAWDRLTTSLALLLVCTGWLVVLKPHVRRYALLGVNLAVSVLLLADLVFYRFYERVIPLPILQQAGQVQSVWDSLVTVLSWRDLLFFSDFLFLVPFLFVWRVQGTGQREIKRRRTAALTMLAGVMLLALNTAYFYQTQGPRAFADLYGNDAMQKHFGILGFHAADVFNTALRRSGNGVSTADRQALITWMDIRRKQGQEGARLTGAAKGKRVIIVQLEAMQNFLIHAKVGSQEVTPTLNKLIGESLYFNQYFAQIGDGNTSDAEFMSLNSLHPVRAGSAYVLKSGNRFQSLPKLLKEIGYQTYVYHGYKPEFYNRETMYPVEGFDKFFSQTYFRSDETIGWGLSDRSLYRQALPMMQRMKGPTLSYLISLSGHHTYKIPEEKKGLTISQGQYSELFTDYLQAQHYADAALGEFLQGLKTSGLLDDALLVVYGDHFANGLKAGEIRRFLGQQEPFDRHQEHELKKVPLFIRLPGGEPHGVQTIIGGQMDLLPTLANLLGLDRSKMFYFGQDLLNSKDGYLVFSHYVERGSFVTNDLFYLAAKNGRFRDGVCYARATGRPVGLNACEAGYKKGQWELEMSDLLLETNSLPAILGGKMKLE